MMSDTYTQIHIQAVFTVSNRTCIIRKNWKEELHRYITGIIQKNGHKLLAINGMPDHVHILFGLRPRQSIADLMQLVKGESSEWINKKELVRGRFSWQEGYGAFSYSRSHLPAVIKYILNQEKHHRRKTFLEEYLQLLEKFQVDFQERNLFKPIKYPIDEI